MKPLTLLLIILGFFCIVTATCTDANANTDKDWALSASIYKTISMDPEAIVQAGSGLQISLHRKMGYLYMSRDAIPVRFAGQRGVDIDLWSAGIGFQYKIGKHFTFSCDAGWYEPVFKDEGVPQIFVDTILSEGLWRYLNEFLSPDEPRVWDYYTLDYHGSIGGKLNLAFEYPVCDWFSIEMTTGYRYLKLPENVKGKNWDHEDSFWTTNYWTIKYDRDFSAWIIGAKFIVSF